MFYTPSDWESRAFLERFDALIGFLNDIDRLEGYFPQRHLIFRFRSSMSMLELAYTSNPFLNEPRIERHYSNLFLGKILPTLQSKFDICPEALCRAERAKEPPACFSMALPLGDSWREFLGSCRNCSRTQSATVFYIEGVSVTDRSDGFFDVYNDVRSKRLDGVFVPLKIKRLFVDDCVANLPGLLRLKYEYLAECDSTWLRYPLAELHILPSFIASLNSGRFWDESEVYFDRLLFTLVQIACNRDVTAQFHRMKSQTIVYNGNQLNKWNAYVFKMGLGRGDARCSRVYYCQTSEGPAVSEYDPDAH